MDPSLSNRRGLLPVFPAAAGGQPSSFGTPTVVVTEGIPLVFRQLMERIRRWEYQLGGPVKRSSSSRDQQGSLSNPQNSSASRSSFQ